ncbi:MAG: hypothetical protein U0457_09240 [Candidatus Sericytochromatia bacterium]
MKKIIYLFIILIFSCTTINFNSKNEKNSDSKTNIEKKSNQINTSIKENNNLENIIINNINQITDEMSYNFILKDLELYTCFGNFNDNSYNNFFEKYKQYVEDVKKNYKPNSSLYKCLYCEDEKETLKKLDFSLDEINNFSVDKFGQKIFLMKYYNLDYNSGLLNNDGTIKRKYLYTIDLFNNVSIFKSDNKISYSCQLEGFFINKNNKVIIGKMQKTNTKLKNTLLIGHLDEDAKINFSSYEDNDNNEQKIPETIFSMTYGDKKNLDKLKVILFDENMFIYPPINLEDPLYYLFYSNKIALSEIKYKELNEAIKIGKRKERDYYVKNNVIPQEGIIKDISDMKSNSKNEIIIADSVSNIIWKLIPYKSIEKIAGSNNTGYKDGKKEESLFNNPTLIDIDDNDNIYVLDKGNKSIRKITPDGKVSTFYKQLTEKIKVTL